MFTKNIFRNNFLHGYNRKTPATKQSEINPTNAQQQDFLVHQQSRNDGKQSHNSNKSRLSPHQPSSNNHHKSSTKF